ncbi:MAG: hypothetical protein AB1Z98_39415 [Nannocystaceae bacterium]
MADTCEVCGDAGAPGASGFNRVGGVDVCDPCYLGLAPQRVRARGWGFVIRQWEVTDGEGTVVAYCTKARLDLSKGFGVHFKCRRKTLGWKLVQLVAPSVKVGDSLFDHHVYVRSKNPGLTRTILADDGVQSIVMDMLGEGSWIEFDRDTMSSYSRREEYVSEARFTSEMCVLASHIERLRGDAPS